MDLYSSLCTITKEENILRDEPMCRHTTFRVGGPADYFLPPTVILPPSDYTILGNIIIK